MSEKVSSILWPEKIAAIRQKPIPQQFWEPWTGAACAQPTGQAYRREDLVEKEMRQVITEREHAWRRESQLHEALLAMLDEKQKLVQRLLDNGIEVPEDTLDGLKVYDDPAPAECVRRAHALKAFRSR